jgi:hypothetical protein
VVGVTIGTISVTQRALDGEELRPLPRAKLHDYQRFADPDHQYTYQGTLKYCAARQSREKRCSLHAPFPAFLFFNQSTRADSGVWIPTMVPPFASRTAQVGGITSFLAPLNSQLCILNVDARKITFVLLAVNYMCCNPWLWTCVDA